MLEEGARIRYSCRPERHDIHHASDRRLWVLAWARLKKDPVALAAAVLLLLLALIIVAAPLTAPRDPLRQEPAIRLSPPAKGGVA